MPTATFKLTNELAQQLLGQSLAEFVSTRRTGAPPMAWDRIARDLWQATDGKIDVSGVSLKKWVGDDEAAA